MTNNLFSFVTIRPPQRINSAATLIKVVLSHAASGNESPFHLELKKLRNSQDAREKMEDRAKQYIASHEFVSAINKLTMPHGGEFSKLDGWLLIKKHFIKLEDLKNEVNRIFGINAVQLVANQDYKDIRRRVGDSLIAWTIYRTDDNLIGPQLVRATRLCGLIERMATSDLDLAERGAIEQAMRALVILPLDLFPLPEPRSEGRKNLLETHSEEQKKIEELRNNIVAQGNRLKALRTAAEELTRAYDAELMDRHTTASEASVVSGYEPPERTVTSGTSATRRQTFGGTFLTEKRLQKLSEKTKSLMKEIEIPIDFVEIPMAVIKIEKEIDRTASKLFCAEGLKDLVKIGKTYVPANTYLRPSMPVLDSWIMAESIPLEAPEAPVADSPSVPETVDAVRIVGVADLEVVRQELQKYEPGEVAHIENILKGEFKERKHRRTRKIEETFETETERVEVTERDLQSTERFELQQETAKTITEDTSLEAGVTVSYGGPTVDVTASTDFAYDHAREDSIRAATSYARDVTERSVARLSESIREKRARLTVEEFEEINTHGIDNKDGSGHVIGIYRWVNKIYEAQVLNYDKRLMLEFTIPEPAAFYRYALSSNPPRGLTLEEPEPPTVTEWVEQPNPSGSFRRIFTYKRVPLAPQYINPEYYLFWVGKYQVPNVETPPPQYRISSANFDFTATPTEIKKDQKEPLIHSTRELKLPPGYVAIDDQVRFGGRAEGAWRLTVIVGDKRITYRSDGTDSQSSVRYEDDIIQLAIEARNWLTLIVTVEVLCERTQAAYQQWQMDTYTAIMTAYNELRARYEEQLRAAQVQDGISISGRNPLRNREIERTELKKAAISMLTGQDIAIGNGPFSDFDAMKNNNPRYGYPEMDLKEASAEGRIIQFFEQAFEWRHMTYIFYPYFWGRKEAWPSILQLDDTDPLFGNFLRAGSARVQVPVRRGYEELVLNYLNTKPRAMNPWPVGDPPGISDDTYLSVVDELAEQLGREFKIGKGTISVTNGSQTVTGTDTNFKDDNIDREILVKGVKYRIAGVTSQTQLTLTENYRGNSNNMVPYSISEYKLIGEPWEVRIPTTLVYLQQDSKLPDWTQA